MASVVRLYLAIIVCAQLALGSLPAQIHIANCDCVGQSTHASSEQACDSELACDDACQQHCHYSDNDVASSADPTLRSHGDRTGGGAPSGEDGTHDEDHCLLCQSVYVYGANTKFASVPVAERLFVTAVPTYLRICLETGKCLLPSPRGPPTC